MLSVFNTSLGTWRMLMHEKPCLIPILKEVWALKDLLDDKTKARSEINDLAELCGCSGYL